MPWPAERAQKRGSAGDVSGATATLQRHWRDGRRGMGVILESGKRNSIVGDACVQSTADGTANLASNCSGKERGQDFGIRKERTRGRDKRSNGNGDARDPGHQTQEEIADLIRSESLVAGAASGIGEGLARFRNELPIVGAGLEGEF